MTIINAICECCDRETLCHVEFHPEPLSICESCMAEEYDDREFGEHSNEDLAEMADEFARFQDCDDYEPDVDESNYDPYSGCDVQEFYYVDDYS